MFERNEPYKEYSLLQIASLVSKGELRPVPKDDWPLLIRNLIDDCCKFNPSHRIQSFEAILDRFDGSQFSQISTLSERLSSLNMLRGSASNQTPSQPIEPVYTLEETKQQK